MNTHPLYKYKHELPFWMVLTFPSAILFIAYLFFGLGEIGYGFNANFPLNNDNFRFMIPKMEIIHRIFLSGEFPFWNPYQGFGIDLWASLSKDPFLTLTMPWFDAVTGIVLIGCLHLALAQIIFYIFGKQLGLTMKAACLAALTFGWSGYFAAYIYDHSIIGSALWSVAILASYLAWRKTPCLTPLVWGAVSTAMAVSFGRPSDFAYFLLFFLIWQLQDSLTAPLLKNHLHDFIRTASAMLLMGVVGITLASPLALPFFLYLAESTRGLALAVAEKSEYMRPDHLHGFFIPTLQTGTNKFIALGAVPLVLAPLLQKQLTAKVKLLGWCALTIFLFQLPLGLFDILRLLPGHEAAWSAVRLIPVGLIAVAALCGVGFDLIFPEDNITEFGKRILRKTIITVAVIAFVFFITSLITTQIHWPIWQYLGVRTKDLNFQLGWGTWAVLGLSIIAWLGAITRPRYAFILLMIAILPATYLVTQSAKAMNSSNQKIQTYSDLTTSETMERFLDQPNKHDFRVHTLGHSLYAMRTAWSGEGLQIDYSYEAAEAVEGYKVKYSLYYQGKYYRNWLNVGGMRYLVGEKSKVPQWVQDNYPLAWHDKDANLLVFQNPNAWPRTFLTSQILIEPDIDKQLLLLGESGVIEPETAILEYAPEFPITQGGKGTAEIHHYGANNVVIKVNSTGNTMLVLSDRINSGWTATLDGQPTPILRTNYMFRGIAMPQGEHTVIFSFRPRGFDIGCIVSAGTLLVLIAGLGFEYARKRRKID